MIELFRNPKFARLFFATVCSQLAATIGTMAFAFYLLDRFSSQPAYATVAEMMYSAPTLLVFLFVGVFADRFDRKRIAENSLWIRAGLSALILGAVAADVWIPLVFLLLFLRSAVTKFYYPAESAMLQGILHDSQYVKAAGLNQSVMGVFMLFGTGLGAVVYHWIGVMGAVTVDLIGFLLGALLLRGLRLPEAVRLPNGRSRLSALSLPSVWGDFREGLRYILGRKLLASLLGGLSLFGLINGCFAMLPMLTMKYKLAGDDYPFYVSMFSVFLGVGVLIGSGIGSVLVGKFALHKVIIACMSATAICVLGLAWSSSPWAYLVWSFIIALFLAPFNIAIGGWLPKLVAPEKMGRVNAWIDPIMMAGQTLMLGLIAWLFPSLFSVEGLHLFIAVLLLAATVVYLATLPRFVREEEREATAATAASPAAAAAGSTTVSG
ncbi:MFS transporter [Paenibacillus albicereus]|uniref:MFS transporter n=1 Tax=Paenibacillus albicereus TaxID=2726185 RepID=A0A6H2GUQ0_9BACL|nr:MFS transporter [Paenibacillus albicereus]QJC50896.1 MFS transporter [Paenibacillus albicereus]